MVELQDNYRRFQELDAEIIAIAQLEKDPALLPRIEAFVRNSFPIVADPDQVSRTPFSLFSVYIIDKKGVLRSHIPGTKAGRPRLDMILGELARIHGGESSRGMKAPIVETPITRLSPEKVLTARFMWSHLYARPGDFIKLALMPLIAPDYHVYAHNETNMVPFSLALDLPKGIRLKSPIVFPFAEVKNDPVLDKNLAWYEGNIPLGALEFEIDADVTPGQKTIVARFTYQACSSQNCLAPTEKKIPIILPVRSSDTEQPPQVYGWKTW